MSSAAQIPEMDGFQDQPLAPRTSRGVYVGFATLVTFGLALAGWYVGERILIAQAPHATVERAWNSTSTAPPSYAAAQPAEPIVLPAVTEHYLQIAALGPAHDPKFLRQLQNKGFNPHLVTENQISSILIGPYEEETALYRARTKLAGSGILAIEIIR
jgi:hypothetical protein